MAPPVRKYRGHTLRAAGRCVKGASDCAQTVIREEHCTTFYVRRMRLTGKVSGERRPDGPVDLARAARGRQASNGSTRQPTAHIPHRDTSADGAPAAGWGAARFTATVDSRKLGLDVAPVILVSAGHHEQIDRPALRDRFSATPQVSYVAFVTGEADILLFGRVAGPKALRRFVFEDVRVLPGVSNTLTLVVLDEAPPRPDVLPDVDDRQPRSSS